MNIALCAIGRRENRYAREFVDHYLQLGFNQIIICDNNHVGEEHFEEVLQDYIDAGQVTILDHRNRRGYQCQAYNEVYAQFGNQYDWIAFFDFDEFLMMKQGSVRQLLEKMQQTPAKAVLVNWMCYGDNGLIYDDGRGVKERFLEPLPFDKAVQYDFPNNDHVKSIIRGGLGRITFRKNPHVPDDMTECYTADGEPCDNSPFHPYSFSTAWLAHYATKSLSEWIGNKWQKGTANKSSIEAFRSKYQGRYFRYNEKTPEKEAYIQAFDRTTDTRMTVCIVHYNTPKLTRCCIKSLQKYSPGVGVIVFDNSDRLPFKPMDGVEVIDNTKGQIINFGEFLRLFPDKVDVGNDWGSAKHCWTVQWLIDKRRNPFILMDSDIIIKKDISCFWDKTQAFVGDVVPHTSRWKITVDRATPLLCFINVPMIKQAGVRYFNPDYMWALTSKAPQKAYDTGCWFLKDVNDHHLPYHVKSIEPYTVHFGHASWKNRNPDMWLMDNQKYWR